MGNNSLIETKENEDTHNQLMPDIQNQFHSISEYQTPAAQYLRYQAAQYPTFQPHQQCQQIPPIAMTMPQTQPASNMFVNAPQLPPLIFYTNNNNNNNSLNSLNSLNSVNNNNVTLCYVMLC